MPSEVDTTRVVAAVTATLNAQQPENWETGRVQELLRTELGGPHGLTVDAGGGVHDEHGVRVAVIRRSPSGEWISERQNQAAEHSDAPVPASSQQND